ncbi:metallophosphoesterase family protein [Tenuifilum thalassicum]|uniref:Phosphoesterase n=1 Tax=Tenuifilum thalassicum TaxID=2590900 RepID=A0A7D3XLI7_9BACT|nr:metallophosphoesterase family protein [Tenuifilum thalassicum]QKG80410.1 metallophosphoesterase family protein [Tenuifilum thalassicum]
MKSIGIVSDTHGFWDNGLNDFFAECDEIWHAGDIGSLELADRINTFKQLRAVYGNIDDHKTRLAHPEFQRFSVENVSVLITHIGGKPGRYEPRVKEQLLKNPVKIFVCGHSHILRVQFDKAFNMLYINPGAAGNNGFHQVKTALRLKIDGENIFDLEVWEKKRGI